MDLPEEKEQLVPVASNISAMAPPSVVFSMPDEPQADDPDSVEIKFRLPISGERMARRFMKDDKIEILYAFIDHLNHKGDCSFELESQSNFGGGQKDIRYELV